MNNALGMLAKKTKKKNSINFNNNPIFLLS